jgi:hypothetical protein
MGLVIKVIKSEIAGRMAGGFLFSFSAPSGEDQLVAYMKRELK